MSDRPMKCPVCILPTDVAVAFAMGVAFGADRTFGAAFDRITKACCEVHRGSFRASALEAAELLLREHPALSGETS